MKNYKKLSFYLLSVTALFFIMTAFTFYFYINKIDNNYQSLVKKELTNFHNLQKIGFIANKNYFYITEIFGKKEVNLDSNWYKWQYLTLINTKNFERLSDSLGIFSKEDSLYKSLVSSRAEYHKTVSYFFEHIKSGGKENYYSYFINTLSPSFTKYESALNLFSESYKEKIINHSDKISREVTNASLGFLLFGFSPLILTIIISVGYLLFALGFIVYIFVSPPILELE